MAPARAAMRRLAQYPLVTATLVALCGVGLIVFSSIWPVSTPKSEPQRALHEQLRARRLQALAGLRAAGASGSVGVVDFGDGIGLGVAAARGVEEGAVLLTVPEALALDVNNTPSCPSADAEELGGAASASAFGDEGGEAEADCRVERAVAAAVAAREAPRLTGLLTLLVMERRRGLVPGLAPTPASAVLAVLPELQWQAEHGLFSIDAEEFSVLGAGTSAEGWREAGVNRTAEAHGFIRRTGSLESDLGGEVSLEEVRWAYLILHAYGQWVEEDALDDGTELPAKALFLLPLFLARPTPEWQHGARLRHDAERRVYEVVAPRAMRPGEEVLFVDRRLSDASAFCFRGLWLSGRHRARLDLDVAAAPRDAQSQPILDKYGCGAQPLRLYVHSRKSVDPHFMSCMRLLVLAGNASKLQRVADRSTWAKAWPETGVVTRQSEMAAAELAIGSLQQALSRLSASNGEIRRRFGSDAVAARPTVRVREAEAMVIMGLLKSMKELQLLSGNEYLFDALRDAQRKPRGSPAPVGTKAKDPSIRA